MRFCRLLILCLAISFSVSAGAAAYTITEFCPDGYAAGDGDEYFILEGSGSLASWSITDGEGTLTFPNDSGKTVVARSGELYYQIHQTYPDYEIVDSLAFVPNAQVSGRFQMANSGDSLTLLHNGAAVQSVSWPEDVATGNGRIHRFEDGSWDRRIFKIGQSDFESQTFTAERATLFVSPDCSYEVITNTINDADESILISMYEFTSPALAATLASAESRGVDVTILIEGGPVGGISEEEKGVLNYLTQKGADVFTIESEGNFPARYRYLHTKYLIIDSEKTIVLSENFKDSGIPESGYGNRGWGAVIEGEEVADYFTQVFDSDLAGYDIYPWVKTSESLPPIPETDQAVTIFHPKTIEDVKVTPVISPDTSYLIGTALSSATSSIDIQQAYISPYPNGQQNPWLGSAIAAAKNGVIVRIQLDGMYYNTDSEADNDEVAASVNRLGLESLHAKIFADRDGILKLHNKGMIIDENLVLISSINWNYNSPTNNREAGIFIESKEAAEYYTRVFVYDWDGVILSDPASVAVGFDIRFILAGVVIAGLIGIFIWRRRH